MPQPRGPTGPLHPRTSPMGTVPASQTHEIWGDMLEPSPKVPCGASMPMRPHLIPACPGAVLRQNVPKKPVVAAAPVEAKRAVIVEKIQRPSSAAGGDSSSGSSHQFLVILSKQQAMDIYTMRSPDTTVDPDLKVVAGKSSMVAEMYGVSPKTIRDIWNRKTWTQVTRPAWTAEEADMHAQEQALAKLPPAERARLKADFKKKRGRPPGSKDSRPRRRRLKDGEEGSVEAPEGLMYVTGSDGAVEVRPIPAAPRGGLFAMPQQQHQPPPQQPQLQQQRHHHHHQPQQQQQQQQQQNEARAREESSANTGMAQHDQYKRPMESPGGCQEDESPMYAGGGSSSSSSNSHAAHHAADEPASMEQWYMAHDDEQNCEPEVEPESGSSGVEPRAAHASRPSSGDDGAYYEDDEEDNSPQLLCGPVDDELAPAVNYYSHYCASTELTMQSFIDDAKKAAASGAGAGAPAAVWMPPMHAEERVAPRCQCQCSCGKGHASGEHHHHGHHHGMQQQEHQHHGHHQHQPKYQHGHHHHKHAPSAPSAASTSHGDWAWMPSPREEWGHHQAASSSSSAAHHPHGAAAPVLVTPIKSEMTAWRPAAGEPGGGNADFSSLKRDGSHDEASWNLSFMDSGVWRANSPPCPW